jgi:hypothetical protein
MVIATARDRPELWKRADDLDADVWPEYNRHGEVLNRYWGRLEHDFASYQFVLYDEGRDDLLAQGHTIPFQWDGTTAGLPAGIDGLLHDAFALRERGGRGPRWEHSRSRSRRKSRLRIRPRPHDGAHRQAGRRRRLLGAQRLDAAQSAQPRHESPIMTRYPTNEPSGINHGSMRGSFVQRRWLITTMNSCSSCAADRGLPVTWPVQGRGILGAHSKKGMLWGGCMQMPE